MIVIHNDSWSFVMKSTTWFCCSFPFIYSVQVFCGAVLKRAVACLLCCICCSTDTSAKTKETTNSSRRLTAYAMQKKGVTLLVPVWAAWPEGRQRCVGSLRTPYLLKQPLVSGVLRFQDGSRSFWFHMKSWWRWFDLREVWHLRTESQSRIDTQP